MSLHFVILDISINWLTELGWIGYISAASDSKLIKITTFINITQTETSSTCVRLCTKIISNHYVACTPIAFASFNFSKVQVVGQSNSIKSQ